MMYILGAERGSAARDSSILRFVARRSRIATMDSVMKVMAAMLEFLFFAGMAGSLVVIIISAIDDIHTIMEKD